MAFSMKDHNSKFNGGSALHRANVMNSGSLSAAAATLGAAGGKSRAKSLSSKERSSIAKQGAAARWK
jgi:hypothetical protein